MEQNLVSVIIPIYNVADYLDTCIASVCSQTYKNTEIILVDDGSTDRSPQICNAWAEKDERIKVIHKKNGGLSSARNAGLDIALGTYILFVDGDDAIASDLLQTTVPYMNEGYETVSFGYQLVYDSGKRQDISFPHKNFFLNTPQETLDFLIGPFFRYEVGWNAWNRLFRKDYIIRHQIEFVDTKRVFAEDQFFCLCYLVHCKKITVLDRCLYFYMQREDSIMGVSNNNHQIHIGQKNELARELLKYYKKQGISQIIIDGFPVIHYQLLDKVVRDVEKRERDPKRLYGIIDEDIRQRSDYNFFTEEMKQFLKQKKVVLREYSSLKTIMQMSRARAMLGKSSLLYLVYLFNLHPNI